MALTIPPQANPYVRETLELLGDRDPLHVLGETVPWIGARTEGLSSDALGRPEGPGQWSLREVVAHLADAEVAFGWRARQMLTADRPVLSGWDQGVWMTRFDYAHADYADAFQALNALRPWNMRVWRSATASDLQRIGMHAERGPETFEFLLCMSAGHDLRHRRQIERLVKVVR